ncbi:hypothetical protein [Flagellimonas aurea]|uniref:hypothetical protein n=1 Tax=Flagellimonas aurea TaxID=2915619 RepID=UPI0035CF6C2C
MVLDLNQKIEEILERNLAEKIEITSVFLVGSHSQNNPGLPPTNDSDIDIIVLNKSLTYKLNNHENGLRYDISIIKDDIIDLLLSAMGGNKTSGKVFTSMNSSQMISDRDGKGQYFSQVITNLYEIFTKSSIPNNVLNSVFLHNLNTNLKDLNENNHVDSYFVDQRFSNQLLDYTASLVYPFNTQGKHRGRVFNNYLLDFEKYLGNTTNGFSNRFFLPKRFLPRIAPILESEFTGFEYSDEILKEILEGRITNFYFGYDDLISEEIIVFIYKENLLRFKQNFSSKELPLSNIVPGLSIEQHVEYVEIIKFLSKEFLDCSLNERLNFLAVVVGVFNNLGLGKLIDNSLRAVIILKSSISLAKDNLKIPLEVYKDWLQGIEVSLSEGIIKERDIILPKTDVIHNLLQTINGSFSFKEKEMKSSYVFFGIMKALRIRMEDLVLTTN